MNLSDLIEISNVEAANLFALGEDIYIKHVDGKEIENIESICESNSLYILRNTYGYYTFYKKLPVNIVKVGDKQYQVYWAETEAPNVGTTYYLIDKFDEGSIVKEYTWDGGTYDRAQLKKGNVYLCQDHAEHNYNVFCMLSGKTIETS